MVCSMASAVSRVACIVLTVALRPCDPAWQLRAGLPDCMQHGLAKGALSKALRFGGVRLGESLDVPADVLAQALAQLLGQGSHARLIRQARLADPSPSQFMCPHPPRRLLKNRRMFTILGALPQTQAPSSQSMPIPCHSIVLSSEGLIYLRGLWLGLSADVDT